MSRRKVTVFEPRSDLDDLLKNGFKFNISKSVIKRDGQTEFNLIWQAKTLQPFITISWDPIYAVNWTGELAGSNSSVTIDGAWQKVDMNQAFELAPDGYWNPTQCTQVPGFFSIKSNYSHADSEAVKIVIGVQNATGDFDPIYVDPVPLSQGDIAEYQPQESLKWWLEADSSNATVITKISSVAGGVDLSNPAPQTNKYEWFTTYNAAQGTWTNSETRPHA